MASLQAPTAMLEGGNHVESVMAYNSTVRVGHDFTISIDEKIDRCIAALRLTDPRADKKGIEHRKGGLLQKSVEWIFDNHEYDKWLHDPECRLLWIKGDAGKGKTMLLCGIINRLSQHQKQQSPSEPAFSPGTLVYFFCQATDDRYNTDITIPRA